MKQEEIQKKLANPLQRKEVFTFLVNEYSERLYWHIRRFVHFHEDANDLVQEVFMKVWEKLDQFKGNSSLYTWIYRIATNEALQYLRKGKRMQLTSITNVHKDGYSIEQELKADPYFNGSDWEAKLHASIDQLPEKQKAVFLLRYFEEMKYEQISEILETSVGALKANYHHALKKLEESLTKEVIN